MKKVNITNIEMYNECCIQGMSKLSDESIDAILTDPPYLFLNHKLDKIFDEDRVFDEFYRVLKNNSFLCIFGRGTPLYKWVIKLEEIGLSFKEEIVWDKNKCVNFTHNLPRSHELCILMEKGKRIMNKVYIPITEEFTTPKKINEIIKMLMRIEKGLKNEKRAKAIIKTLINNSVDFDRENKSKNNNVQGNEKMKACDRAISDMKLIRNGRLLKSVIECFHQRNEFHPTQKPVKLLNKIVQLISNEGEIILDAFAGSFSTAQACINHNRKFIGYEIDKEYFEMGMRRFEEKLAI